MITDHIVKRYLERVFGLTDFTSQQYMSVKNYLEKKYGKIIKNIKGNMDITEYNEFGKYRILVRDGVARTIIKKDEENNE